MPLPAFSYSPNNLRGKFDDTSDSSDEEGVDGILSLLRSNKSDSNHAAPKNISSSVKTPTSATSSKTSLPSTTKSILSSRSSSSSSAKTPTSIRSNTPDINPNTPLMQRRVKFDPAFAKPNQGVSNMGVHSNRSSKQNELTADAETRPSEWKRDSSSVVESLSETPNHVSQQNTMSEDTTEEEKLTPIVHNKRQHTVETDPSFVDMMHKITTSQQSIQELCIGIKELQQAASTSSKRDDTSSKSVDNLLQSVSKSQEQLGDLTLNLSRMLDELKSGNELQVSLAVVESRYAIHLILLLVL